MIDEIILGVAFGLVISFFLLFMFYLYKYKNILIESKNLIKFLIDKNLLDSYLKSKLDVTMVNDVLDSTLILSADESIPKEGKKNKHLKTMVVSNPIIPPSIPIKGEIIKFSSGQKVKVIKGFYRNYKGVIMDVKPINCSYSLLINVSDSEQEIKVHESEIKPVSLFGF